MVNDIDKISKRYARQELLLTAALFLITLLVMRVWYLDELLVPVIVSAAFTLVVSTALAVIWRMALAVMFVYYLVNGRDAMLVFFLVFMAFYLVSLIHHSVFFARVSNRS